MTKKEEFLKGFDEDFQEVTVEVTVPNCPETELIINPKANFAGKKTYYEKAYNDNLELNTFNQIKIVGFTFKQTNTKHLNGAFPMPCHTA